MLLVLLTVAVFGHANDGRLEFELAGLFEVIEEKFSLKPDPSCGRDDRLVTVDGLTASFELGDPFFDEDPPATFSD